MPAALQNSSLVPRRSSATAARTERVALVSRQHKVGPTSQRSVYTHEPAVVPNRRTTNSGMFFHALLVVGIALTDGAKNDPSPLSNHHGSAVTDIGLCAAPCSPPIGDCERDLAGIWERVDTLQVCVAKCSACAQCTHVSFSTEQRECFWWRFCDLQILHTSAHDSSRSFRTLAVKRAGGRRGSDGVKMRGGRHKVHDASAEYLRTDFIPASPSLTPEMLDRGIELAHADERLACFFRRSAHRPVTIAAIGGSITELGGYHRKLAEWLRARHPRTQAALPNRIINLGVGGNGPGMNTMCLTSLLPAPPDLVLLEYAVNIVERKELEFYDTLLRQFRAAGVPTVAVNADRYDEQGHMRCKCANPAGFSRYEPTGFVREMEQLARQHATPIISLRHAVQPEIGRPGFTIKEFMNDCRHPNDRGSEWISHLIAEALVRANGVNTTCTGNAKRRRARAWPAEVQGAAFCLRGNALREATLSSEGFQYFSGRKPGWYANRTGSTLRIKARVALLNGASSKTNQSMKSVLQLGFLYSCLTLTFIRLNPNPDSNLTLTTQVSSELASPHGFGRGLLRASVHLRCPRVYRWIRA